MITKSGKHHYQCDFSLTFRDGRTNIMKGHTFISADGEARIRKDVESYAKRGVRAVFENLVDLDA